MTAQAMKVWDTLERNLQNLQKGCRGSIGRAFVCFVGALHRRARCFCMLTRDAVRSLARKVARRNESIAMSQLSRRK